MASPQRHRASLVGHHLGRWPTIRAAGIARDRAVFHLGLDLPLRFSRSSLRLGPASPAPLTKTGLYGVYPSKSGT